MDSGLALRAPRNGAEVTAPLPTTPGAIIPIARRSLKPHAGTWCCRAKRVAELMTDAVALDPPPLPAAPPPLPGGPPPLPGLVRFVGQESAYWQLRIKGAALLLLTLGIYRFWLMTDVRRFLWSNTEIAGDTLEYDGLATELLVGFLFAIAILIPIYVAMAAVSLALDLPDYASALGGLALFVVFGEFARYRARRYRLTRTVFRGLRFHQDGSGWLYALYAILCWCLIIVSFGLAYPWAQANLQRYMMRHTSYGKLPGRFEGSGWALFLSGLPLWLLTAAPFLAAAGFVAAFVDWHAFNGADPEDKGSALAVIAGGLMERLGSKTLGALAFGAVGGSILIAALLYPVFQAIIYRWWLSGLRFGGIAVTSRLRIGQVYLIYLRFIGLVWLFMLAASIGTGIVASLVYFLLNASHISASRIPGHEIIGAAFSVGLYAVFALGLSAMHQVLITFGLWRAAAQSADISDASILESVEAKAGLSSALGEGLVDALGFGSV
jgi:uncharacterized membrane protein YjgN (DUF898 family)